MVMPAKRRFTLIDAITLVAAVGIGLAWVRYNRTNVLSYFVTDLYDAERDHYPIPRPWRGVWYYVSLLWVWLASFLPLFAVTTVAIVALRFRQPRRPLRRLVKQPGFVACAAASLALVSSGVGNAITVHLGALFLVIENPGKPYPYPEYYLPDLTNYIDPGYVGIAAVSAWLILLLGGRQRRIEDWVDRVGWLLGIFWMTMVPISWIDRWL